VSDDRVREDLALIREAIEEGRGYATRCGPDMMVWGIVVALGYVATYAWVRGYALALRPNWLWPAAIGLAWLYSLRHLWRRALGNVPLATRSPMVMSLRMLWLGCGISLTTLAVAALWSNEARYGWFDAVVAGTLGAAVFATAWLAGLPWLRWIAFGWWAGELAVFGLRHRPEALLLSAALMLALLAAPGLALVIERRPRRDPA
jgi:hypothetical protein